MSAQRRFLPMMILAFSMVALVLSPSSAVAQNGANPSDSVTPSTVRTTKGDLVTGDAEAFAEALEQIGPDGEVLVWIKETTTPRPDRVTPSTGRTTKGDLVTGDAEAFAEALEQIGPDGEVMVWIKETTTPRPSAEFLLKIPGSAAETIALKTEAPGAKRRNNFGPAAVRGASIGGGGPPGTGAGAARRP